jgi:hypothetical protein
VIRILQFRFVPRRSVQGLLGQKCYQNAVQCMQADDPELMKSLLLLHLDGRFMVGMLCKSSSYPTICLFGCIALKQYRFVQCCLRVLRNQISGYVCLRSMIKFIGRLSLVSFFKPCQYICSFLCSGVAMPTCIIPQCWMEWTILPSNVSVRLHESSFITCFFTSSGFFLKFFCAAFDLYSWNSLLGTVD